jgi:hypothetical protein
MLSPGDPISFFHLNDAAPLGTAPATLAAAPRRVRDPAVIRKALAAPAVMEAPPYSAHFAKPTFGSAVFQLDFEPGTALAAGVQDYWALAQCLPLGDVGGLVADSLLHDGYARSLMAKSSGLTVSGSRFERAGGLFVSAEQAWLEGCLALRDVTVVDNVFTALGSPALTIAPYVVNVTTRNNTEKGHGSQGSAEPGTQTAGAALGLYI